RDRPAGLCSRDRSSRTSLPSTTSPSPASSADPRFLGVGGAAAHPRMTRSTGRTGGAAVLEVSNLEVVYNEVILVLRGLSLVVPDDQIVALLGANGAGKTTTL